MRRTKLEAETTRETILAVAERLFLESGVTEVSLEQIAVAAGFTRGRCIGISRTSRGCC